MNTIIRGPCPVLTAFLITTLAAAQSLSPSTVQIHRPSSVHQIRLEVFSRGDSELSSRAIEYANRLGERTRGLNVVVHDVLEDRDQLTRLWKLARQAGRDKPVVPAFRSCDRLYFGFASERETGPAVENLFTADVYTRSTCPRCKSAKAFINNSISPKWPALRFRIFEITYDAAARQRYEQLCRSRGRIPGLPTIDFAGQVLIGYQGDHITGAQLENLIRRVAGDDNPPSKPATNESSFVVPPALGLPVQLVGFLSPDYSALVQATKPIDDEDEQDFVAAVDDSPDDVSSGEPLFDDVPIPDDLELPDDLALPEEATPTDSGEAKGIPPESDSDSISDVIVLPWFGEVRVGDLGLPLFTFLVGLVDGFNPCAMWILVFLLSVLVNIKDRGKILLIAGTFVVVSGVAYFAFMAAWLNLFMLIGIARPAQIILGLMAILIGVINVKDFFAFKRGVTLSIPESSKPGLYKRVRQIVSAEYLSAALMGVVALAVIVNMVELLCTAGLPALYTQILTMQDLPAWKNYAYLGLYISAYMLDDSILLAIVVATLSHRKLQEREGRWLKLMSGLVILALGLVMIFRPDWLMIGH